MKSLFLRLLLLVSVNLAILIVLLEIGGNLFMLWRLGGSYTPGMEPGSKALRKQTRSCGRGPRRPTPILRLRLQAQCRYGEKITPRDVQQSWIPAERRLCPPKPRVLHLSISALRSQRGHRWSVRRFRCRGARGENPGGANPHQSTQRDPPFCQQADPDSVIRTRRPQAAAAIDDPDLLSVPGSAAGLIINVDGYNEITTAPGNVDAGTDANFPGLYMWRRLVDYLERQANQAHNPAGLLANYHLVMSQHWARHARDCRTATCYHLVRLIQYWHHNNSIDVASSAQASPAAPFFFQVDPPEATTRSVTISLPTVGKRLRGHAANIAQSEHALPPCFAAQSMVSPDDTVHAAPRYRVHSARQPDSSRRLCCVRSQGRETKPARREFPRRQRRPRQRAGQHLFQRVWSLHPQRLRHALAGDCEGSSPHPSSVSPDYTRRTRARGCRRVEAIILAYASGPRMSS